jgi:hypothetical protein
MEIVIKENLGISTERADFVRQARNLPLLRPRAILPP